MIPYNRYAEQTWQTSFNLYKELLDSESNKINSVEDFKEFIFNATLEELTSVQESLSFHGRCSIIVNDCITGNQEISQINLDTSIPAEIYSEARRFFINHFKIEHEEKEHEEKELEIIKTFIQLKLIDITSYENNYDGFEKYIADLKAKYIKHQYGINALNPSLESVPFQNKNKKTSYYFALKALAAMIGLIGLALIGLVIAAAVFSAGPLVIIATALASSAAVTATFIALGVAGALMALPIVAIGIHGLFNCGSEKHRQVWGLNGPTAFVHV